jgi:hypothetical protein
MSSRGWPRAARVEVLCLKLVRVIDRFPCYGPVKLSK